MNSNYLLQFYKTLQFKGLEGYKYEKPIGVNFLFKKRHSSNEFCGDCKCSNGPENDPISNENFSAHFDFFQQR